MPSLIFPWNTQHFTPISPIRAENLDYCYHQYRSTPELSHRSRPVRNFRAINHAQLMVSPILSGSELGNPYIICAPEFQPHIPAISTQKIHSSASIATHIPTHKNKTHSPYYPEPITIAPKNLHAARAHPDSNAWSVAYGAEILKLHNISTHSSSYTAHLEKPNKHS